MSRSTTQSFHTELLAQLARQLRFGPIEVRRAQVRRAEALHDQLDPEVDYPYAFLAYRITGSRDNEDSSLEPTVISGAAAASDLRLLIDLLSKSAPAPLEEEAEPVESLAQRLGVSTRTIWRWRRIGLRWRWVLLEGRTRPVLVYPAAAVAKFTSANAELVSRAAAFSQIEPEKRQAIIERARRLVQARELTLNQVATHLARRTGRALETLRQILQQHDRDWPDRPIFPGRQGPLTARQKRVIARAYEWGIPATKIGRRFSRTRATILRVVRQRRASELARQRIEFIPMPTFDRPDAEAVILQSAHAHPKPPERRRAPAPRVDDLPAPVRAVFESPPLSPEDAHELLVRINFLKYRARKLRDSLDRRDPSASTMDQIVATLHRASLVREQLVRGHARLTLSLVRRHLAVQSETSPARLYELLSLAHPMLLEAIEHYDPMREQTFEAFFTWSLMRRLAGAPAGARAHRRADDSTLSEWASGA